MPSFAMCLFYGALFIVLGAGGTGLRQYPSRKKESNITVYRAADTMITWQSNKNVPMDSFVSITGVNTSRHGFDTNVVMNLVQSGTPDSYVTLMIDDSAKYEHEFFMNGNATAASCLVRAPVQKMECEMIDPSMSTCTGNDDHVGTVQVFATWRLDNEIERHSLTMNDVWSDETGKVLFRVQTLQNETTTDALMTLNGDPIDLKSGIVDSHLMTITEQGERPDFLFDQGLPSSTIMMDHPFKITSNASATELQDWLLVLGEAHVTWSNSQSGHHVKSFFDVTACEQGYFLGHFMLAVSDKKWFGRSFHAYTLDSDAGWEIEASNIAANGTSAFVNMSATAVLGKCSYYYNGYGCDYDSTPAKAPVNFFAQWSLLSPTRYVTVESDGYDEHGDQVYHYRTDSNLCNLTIEVTLDGVAVKIDLYAVEKAFLMHYYDGTAESAQKQPLHPPMTMPSPLVRRRPRMGQRFRQIPRSAGTTTTATAAAAMAATRGIGGSSSDDDDDHVKGFETSTSAATQ